jgi:plasmid stability protein
MYDGDMKSIQIRDVPDSIHRTLKERAARAGVSLSEYLLAEVRRVAERPAVSDVLRLAAGRSGGVEAGEIVESVRSGRDHSGGR